MRRTLTLRTRLCLTVCCTLVLGTSSWTFHGSRNKLYKAGASSTFSSTFLQQPAVQEDVEQGIDHPKATAERQINRTLHAPETADQIRRDAMHTVLTKFMPGYTFQVETGLALLGVIALASTWFTFYFLCLYTSDRTATFNHWADRLKEWKESTEFYKLCEEQALQPTADVVLVFHHPDFAHDDQDREVTRDLIMGCLKTSGMTQSSGTTPRPEHLEEFAKTAAKHHTMKDARLALLFDVYAKLQEWGCEVEISRSVTRAELLLFARFTDQDAIQSYISHNRLSFQLQRDLVSSLKVNHPRDDICSTPPSVPFNPLHVKLLHEAGLIKADDKSLVYRCSAREGVGNLLRSADRIRFIVDELLHVFDLEATKQRGLLIDWYPVHDYRCGLEKMNVCWANHRLLFDATSLQPIIQIRNYFGDRLAFIFAWYGTYTKSLLALLLTSACVWMVTSIMIFIGYHPARASTMRVLGASCILAVWSRTAHNIWQRERSFFKVLFDDKRSDGQIGARPQFVGWPRPSPENLERTEMHYPTWRAIIRRLFSYLATLTYSFFAASIVTAVTHQSVISNGGTLSVWANVTIVILLQAFKRIYGWIAYNTTEFENHKFYDEYYNSYFWKLVFFGFVNYYVPFFHMAFMQGGTTGVPCPEVGCISALQQFLNTSLLMVGGYRVAEVLFFSLWAKYNLWANKKEHDASDEAQGNITWVEQQAKLPKFEKMLEIDAMIDIVFSLGYVLIFGAVAIGTVLICYVVFKLQVRATAYLLTTSAQRIVPETSTDGVVKARDDVVALIMTIGVLFEGFLIVTYDDSFSQAAPITKLMGIIIFWSLVFVLWNIVDLYYPPLDSQTDLLERRRRYTLTKYMKKTGQLISNHHRSVNRSAVRELTMEEVSRCQQLHQKFPRHMTPTTEEARRDLISKHLEEEGDEDDQFELSLSHMVQSPSATPQIPERVPVDADDPTASQSSLHHASSAPSISVHADN